ncbi:MAG: hypothetical protein A3G32_01225 [Deltaproteobacteria bacterium RIFCSPLOWO2_12_FULL_40_28]|nr:MAG: hypothetical protein A3C45_10110 [Deltaproteobacteria bacterium RIFCSPHIGHO2_02_FULL_40_28]OGQ19951.1 MAG: hypothetical protein A3E27_07060 [Deltaproteobacteria bacterium RIFCSPHIGHO2_12_FULL_40_32]OGQ39711.1 MAG: hypothetical protein A3I69_06490 [Deltaproteobacteria bacterium RIFCSPLOWO2_02_FULL_40_36]OGQ52966.1 MAG: hypothetical protein A3G32_01225 [Deltaproteobacteria bacterium RIFCSPLOWO2_12_FULL_40_28]
MTIEIIAIMIIFGAGLWFLFSPLAKNDTDEISLSTFQEDLALRKANVIAGLKDLKLDRALNKVSEEDFKEMENEAMNEGATLLKQIDNQQKGQL